MNHHQPVKKKKKQRVSSVKGKVAYMMADGCLWKSVDHYQQQALDRNKKKRAKQKLFHFHPTLDSRVKHLL